MPARPSAIADDISLPVPFVCPYIVREVLLPVSSIPLFIVSVLPSFKIRWTLPDTFTLCPIVTFPSVTYHFSPESPPQSFVSAVMVVTSPACLVFRVLPSKYSIPSAANAVILTCESTIKAASK